MLHVISDNKQLTNNAKQYDYAKTAYMTKKIKLTKLYRMFTNT